MEKEMQLLAFERAGKRFAIVLEDLQGFYSLHSPEKHQGNPFCGRVPARGTWVNVLDLFPKVKYSRTACAVVLERGNQRIGLASDLVEGIISAPHSMHPLRDKIETALPEVVTSAFEFYGKSYLFIDIETVFQWALRHVEAVEAPSASAVAIDLLA